MSIHTDLWRQRMRGEAARLRRLGRHDAARRIEIAHTTPNVRGASFVLCASMLLLVVILTIILIFPDPS